MNKYLIIFCILSERLQNLFNESKDFFNSNVKVNHMLLALFGEISIFAFSKIILNLSALQLICNPVIFLVTIFFKYLKVFLNRAISGEYARIYAKFRYFISFFIVTHRWVDAFSKIINQFEMEIFSFCLRKISS